ncbi:MAG: NuoM family protein [Promethearchaeota archaeon]
MQNPLLLMFTILLISLPIVYIIGKKNIKAAGIIIALVCVINIGLLSTIIPTILDPATGYRHVETYYWIPPLGAYFSLFVDGISLPLVIITLLLILAVAVFSIDSFQNKKSPAEYFALLVILSIGLLGIFTTSNLLFFYFCWELVLVPSYFIIGEWGYGKPYKAALKFVIFTHAGAVLVLLSIGLLFIVTGQLDIFLIQPALLLVPSSLVLWILILLTLGFLVKMAIVPFHMWLPDAYSEAPAPMSALLSGSIAAAGAYAILRLILDMVLPAILSTVFAVYFLQVMALLGVITALFGALIALGENDIKRILAYSSISQLGYILFGLSLFPNQIAMTGTVLHLVNHTASKALFFLSAGAIIHQIKTRNIRQLGGLSGQMPVTATSTVTAGLSIAAIPPFACFISEFLIFTGGFQVATSNIFYLVMITLLLIATLVSLAYVLRYFNQVIFGSEVVKDRKLAPFFMRCALIILTILVIVLGIGFKFFIDIIGTATFGG